MALGQLKASYFSPSFALSFSHSFKRSEMHDLSLLISLDNDFHFRQRESSISIKHKQSANIILQAAYKKFIIPLKASKSERQQNNAPDLTYDQNPA